MTASVSFAVRLLTAVAQTAWLEDIVTVPVTTNASGAAQQHQAAALSALMATTRSKAAPDLPRHGPEANV